MKYYNSKANSLIDSSELLAMYGTMLPINELGIYELSVQPDYIPVGFTDLGNDTWYPIESYVSMKHRCVQALMETGMSEEEALAVLG